MSSAFLFEKANIFFQQSGICDINMEAYKQV